MHFNKRSLILVFVAFFVALADASTVLVAAYASAIVGLTIVIGDCLRSLHTRARSGADVPMRQHTHKLRSLCHSEMVDSLTLHQLPCDLGGTGGRHGLNARCHHVKSAHDSPLSLDQIRPPLMWPCDARKSPPASRRSL